MADEIDQTVMTDIKTHATDLETDHAERDADFELYEDAYLMKWREEAQAKPQYQHMRVTQSPDAHNQVRGAVRLMVATDPQFNVSDIGEEAPDAEKVEGYANRLWTLSGRLAGEPIHHALILSGILYDEMHALVTPCQEMVDYLKKSKPESDREKRYRDANLKQWEQIQDRQQFIIQAANPMGGYPEFGQIGLTAYHRQDEYTVAGLRDRFGFLPAAYANAKRTDKVTLNSYWDNVYTAYWTDACDIYLGEHGYGFVPVVCQIVDGSSLFADAENRRQPLLYSMVKSGLLDAQNLALTVMYTNVLAMGSVTKFVYVPQIKDSRPEFDWAEEIAYLQPGDQLAPLDMRNLIPQPLMTALELSTQKGQESTIYPAALGAPAEKNTTYSEFALMSQSGRLPLVGPQRRGGWAISKVIEMVFNMARQTPGYLKGSGLTTADIPQGIMIDTKLEVKLPQERLQMANVAQMLNNLGISNEWIVENVLGINNPNELRRQRWSEQTGEIMYQEEVKKLMQEAAQRQQQMQAQAQQMQQPPQGPPPGMMEQQGPPEPMQSAGPMMPPGQAEQIQGLPPQQGGMIPGMGQAEVPPGMEGGQ